MGEKNVDNDSYFIEQVHQNGSKPFLEKHLQITPPNYGLVIFHETTMMNDFGNSDYSLIDDIIYCSLRWNFVNDISTYLNFTKEILRKISILSFQVRDFEGAAKG